MPLQDVGCRFLPAFAQESVRSSARRTLFQGPGPLCCSLVQLSDAMWLHAFLCSSQFMQDNANAPSSKVVRFKLATFSTQDVATLLNLRW